MSQLTIMSQSGVDLAEALDNITQQATKPVLRIVLIEVHADAIPCALARAVHMLGFRRTEDAVLALDLSHRLPLVVLVVRGRPVFVRELREAGIATLTKPLRDEFHLSDTECQQLLTRFGIPTGDQPVSPIVTRTLQLIHHTASRL